MDSIYNADGKIVEYDGSVFHMINPVVVWGADLKTVYITCEQGAYQVDPSVVPARLYGECVQEVQGSRLVTAFPELDPKKGFTVTLVVLDTIGSSDSYLSPVKSCEVRGITSPQGVCTVQPFKERIPVTSVSDVLLDVLDQVRVLTWYSSSFVYGDAYSAQEIAQTAISASTSQQQVGVLALCGWQLHTPVSLTNFLNNYSQCGAGGTEVEPLNQKKGIFFALYSPLQVFTHMQSFSFVDDDYSRQMAMGTGYSLLMTVVVHCILASEGVVTVLLRGLVHSYLSYYHRIQYLVSSLFVNPSAQWSTAFSAAPALIGPNVGYAAPYFMLIGNSRKVLSPDFCDGGPVKGIIRIGVPTATTAGFYAHRWVELDWSGIETWERQHLLYQVNTFFPEDMIHADGFVLARANYTGVNCDEACADRFCVPVASGAVARVGLLEASFSQAVSTCSAFEVWTQHLERLLDAWGNEPKQLTTSILCGTHSRDYAPIPCGESSLRIVQSSIDTVEDAVPVAVCVSTPLKELIRVKLDELQRYLQRSENRFSTTDRRFSVKGEDFFCFTVSYLLNASSTDILRDCLLHSFDLCTIPFHPRSTVYFSPLINNPHRGWFFYYMRESAKEFAQEVRVYGCKVAYEFIVVSSENNIEVEDASFYPDSSTAQLLASYPFEGRPVLVKSYLGYKQKQLIFHTDTELVYIQVRKESESDPDVGSVVRTIQIPSPPAPVYAVADLRVFEEVISLLAQSR